MIYGGAGGDVVHGGDGIAWLFGGADGDDLLLGDEGTDVLIGGAGADVFDYYVGLRTIASADLVETVNNGTDTIKDFTLGLDKIALQADAADYTYDDEDPSAPPRPTLSFDDIFLSQDDSVAVIEAGVTVTRLEGGDIDDLDASDFLF